MKGIGVVLVVLVLSAEALQVNSITNLKKDISQLAAPTVRLLSHVETVLKGNQDFISFLQLVTQIASRLSEQHNTRKEYSNSNEQLVQLTAQATDSINRNCIFRNFSGSISDATTVPVSGIASESDCQTACQTAQVCIGYVFNTTETSCSVITKLQPLYGERSAICIRRGGCAGEGDEDECAWLSTSNTNIPNSLTATLAASDNTFTEQQCAALCEKRIQSDCIGYHFQQSGLAVGNCRFFNAFSGDQSLTTGLCLPRPSVAVSNGTAIDCWKSEQCSFPTISLPTPAATNALVVLRTAQNLDVTGGLGRAEQSSVTFSNITFENEGALTVNVWAHGLSCPATTPVTVRDRDAVTFWITQPGFPKQTFPNLEFIVVRFKHDCMGIVVLMVASAFLCLVSLLFFLKFAFGDNHIGAVVMFVGMVPTFIFTWDMYHALRYWKCKID
eukprot:c6192_g1_i1.p1 GENE.c6192_g1_i1~~c6192_g1_i1.p1  ORF type:complete len:444 (+),score=126.44 c6192_g1_i1:32-1363(+)